MLLVGVVMYFNSQATKIYSNYLLASILICSILFLLKSIFFVLSGIQQWQKCLLAVCVVVVVYSCFSVEISLVVLCVGVRFPIAAALVCSLGIPVGRCLAGECAFFVCGGDDLS